MKVLLLHIMSLERLVTIWHSPFPFPLASQNTAKNWTEILSAGREKAAPKILATIFVKLIGEYQLWSCK